LRTLDNRYKWLLFMSLYIRAKTCVTWLVNFPTVIFFSVVLLCNHPTRRNHPIHVIPISIFLVSKITCMCIMSILHVYIVVIYCLYTHNKYIHTPIYYMLICIYSSYILSIYTTILYIILYIIYIQYIIIIYIYNYIIYCLYTYIYILSIYK
jgi:hypothetical protein